MAVPILSKAFSTFSCTDWSEAIGEQRRMPLQMLRHSASLGDIEIGLFDLCEIDERLQKSMIVSEPSSCHFECFQYIGE